MSLHFSKFSFGFTQGPFRIPQKITIKQFYAIFKNLQDSYKSLALTPESLSAVTTSNIAGREETEDSECKVCFERKYEVVLRCNHVFCQTCFDEWKDKNDSCAMCRQSLIPSVAKEGNEMHISKECIYYKDLRGYLYNLGKVEITLKRPPPIPQSPLHLNARSRSGVHIRRQAPQRPSLSSPWVCLICTYEGNSGSRSVCQMCGTSRRDSVLHALLSDLEVLESHLGGGGNAHAAVRRALIRGQRLQEATMGMDGVDSVAARNEASQSLDVDLQLALLLSASQM